MSSLNKSQKLIFTEMKTIKPCLINAQIRKHSQDGLSTYNKCCRILHELVCVFVYLLSEDGKLGDLKVIKLPDSTFS